MTLLDSQFTGEAEAQSQATDAAASQEIEIDKLVYGGDGLGRLPSGEVLFVPWSVPGDRLRVTRQPGTQKPAKGLIQDVLTPSTDRVTPQCSVFGECGGCQWQHITSTVQQDWKRRIVAESLERIGKLSDVEVLETLGVDTEADAWHFRNRVQWEVAQDAEGQYQLGYNRANSHDVVAFEQCRIIPETLNRIANRLQGIFKSYPQLAATIHRIEAMINVENRVLLRFRGRKNPDWVALTGQLQAEFPEIVGMLAEDASRKNAPLRVLMGQGQFTERLGGQLFTVSAGSFFQTNRKGGEVILDVLARCMLSQVHSLLDVYAGVGVFALHFKDKFQRIVAVESAPSAMADARENIRLNNAPHIELKTGDAKAILRNMKERFDVAIIDPPRAGCQPEVLDWLSRQVDQQLLYVSCNPTTLARDLKRLTENGWLVESVQPIDMFPQTYHIEAVASLKRI